MLHLVAENLCSKTAHLYSPTGCTPFIARRFAPAPPMSAFPAFLMPIFVFDEPMDSCARSSIKSNTFSWYTSAA
jgi:hypothetical protein